MWILFKSAHYWRRYDRFFVDLTSGIEWLLYTAWIFFKKVNATSKVLFCLNHLEPSFFLNTLNWVLWGSYQESRLYSASRVLNRGVLPARFYVVKRCKQAGKSFSFFGCNHALLIGTPEYEFILLTQYNSPEISLISIYILLPA